MLGEKSRLNRVLKLQADLCLIASYQYIIHIENACVWFFETDSMVSVMDTIVSTESVHICKCSGSSPAYETLEKKKQKKNGMISCFVLTLIGYITEEFYEDSLNC